MIEMALIITLIFIALQLGLLLFILIEKARNNSFQKESSRLYREKLPQFIAYVQGTTTEKPDINAPPVFAKEVIQKILRGLEGNFNGEKELLLIKELADFHLAELYKKDLYSRRWADRVNTLYFIEDFQMYSLKEHVWEHLSKVRKSDEEYRQCLRTAASFQDKRLIVYLMERELAPGLLREVFRRFDEELLMETEVIIKSNEITNKELLIAFLTYCGEAKRYAQLPMAEEMLHSSDKEVRISSLKSIYNYQYMLTPELLHPFLESSHWEERMYAAKIAGAMSIGNLSSVLMQLMADENWWVRYSSSEALKLMPDGELLLEFAASEHEDKFARDMARQTLTAGGGGRK